MALELGTTLKKVLAAIPFLGDSEIEYKYDENGKLVLNIYSPTNIKIKSEDTTEMLGNIDFTNANVIGLDLGGTNGEGIPELTTETVRITDLEDGIYKWVYNGVKTFYYDGETSTENTTFSSANVIIIVYGTRTINDTRLKYSKQWVAFAESGSYNASMSAHENIIYFGCTDASDGSISSKDLRNIPRTEAVLTSYDQSIQGTKIFEGQTKFLQKTTFDRAKFVDEADFSGCTVKGLSASDTHLDLRGQVVNNQPANSTGTVTAEGYASINSDFYHSYVMLRFALEGGETNFLFTLQPSHAIIYWNNANPLTDYVFTTTAEIGTKVQTVTLTVKNDLTWECVFTDTESEGGGESESSPTIIDVATLPTENINPNVIYRVPSCVYYYGLYIQSDVKTSDYWFIAHPVESLPEVGNPAVVFDSSGTPIGVETYYNIQDGENYGYIDETLSQVFSVPVGWYPVSQLFAVANYQYGGIVSEMAAGYNADGIFRLLVQPMLYVYKDGKWTMLNDYSIYFGANKDSVIAEEQWKKILAYPEKVTIKGLVTDNIYVILRSAGTVLINSDNPMPLFATFYQDMFEPVWGFSYVIFTKEDSGYKYEYGTNEFDINEFIRRREGNSNDIDSTNTFNGETIFRSKVYFTDAEVIGLPSGGLTQEEVQSMIDTSINGALEGDY